MIGQLMSAYQNRYLTDKSDVFYGSNNNEMIYARDGNDYVHGGGGRDIIDGGKGDDSINGGSGNDIIRGGDGDDFMTGGSGADVFEFEFARYTNKHGWTSIAPSADTITDFESGQDKLNVSALNLDNWDDLFDGGRDYMYQNGADTIIVANAAGPYNGAVTITLKNTDIDDLSADDFIF